MSLICGDELPMSETWYQVSSWRSEIKPYEFERSTDHILFSRRNGREVREHKETSYCRYFRTYEEAKQHVTAKAARNLEAARARLRQAEIDLKHCESL